MSLTDRFREHRQSQKAKAIVIEELDTTIYVHPLTLAQSREINQEDETWTRIGRHFQVRARDADGNHLIPPGDFDSFMANADMAIIAKAVEQMDVLEDPEETEKKS